MRARRIAAFMLLVFLLANSILSAALAEIDWSGMTEKEICLELQRGKAELLSRFTPEFEIGKPFLFTSDYGSFTFTLENVHVVEAGSYLQREYGSDAVVVCVQGICDNTDGTDWVIGYRVIPFRITVVDQDGFSLFPIFYSGVNDGRYEVMATTNPGEKKRVSLTYIGFTDTVSVTVSIPNVIGAYEFSLVP